MRLNVERAGYGGLPVLRNLLLSLTAGEITAFCGPNGSGKSTALKLMRGLLSADAGGCELHGKPIEDYSAKSLARELAMLSQSPSAPEDMSVSDLVMLGRYAHRGLLGSATREDRDAADAALHSVDMHAHRERSLSTLSGGQQQRVWLAMVLAQASPVILLDEPTNHLDIQHALQLLQLLRDLCNSRHKTIVVVLHDLNLAAGHADRLVLFQDGRIAADGPVADVLSESTVERVFQVHCQIVRNPNEPPRFIPIRAL